MSKRILVTGSTGMVGSRFVELHPKPDDMFQPRSYELDVRQPEQIQQLLDEYQPEALINFAAFTDIGAGERERGNTEGDCWTINVLGVENLVNSIDPEKTHFIQISTDMVFSGSEENPGPYKETDMPEKNSDDVTWYGYTSGQAENVVRTVLGDKAAIVRIIYPVRARYEEKLDYARKLMKLKEDGKLYPLFDDQQISVTYIDELAQALEKIADERIGGTMHVSSADLTTPYEFGSYLFSKIYPNEQIQIQKNSIKDFLKDRKDARYPVKSGFDTTATQQKLGMQFRTWQQIVDALVEQGISI